MDINNYKETIIKYGLLLNELENIKVSKEKGEPVEALKLLKLLKKSNDLKRILKREKPKYNFNMNINQNNIIKIMEAIKILETGRISNDIINKILTIVNPNYVYKSYSIMDLTDPTYNPYLLNPNPYKK